MMTPKELALMVIDAKMTLQVADNDGWTSEDRSRSLAELAIKAAAELTALQAENAKLREENAALLGACVALFNAADLVDTSINLALLKSPNIESYLRNDLHNITAAIAQAKEIEAIRSALANKAE